VHKRKQYPFITRGTGEKIEHRKGLNVSKKIRKQQNMKNIQFAFRHKKLATQGKLLSYPCQNHFTYLCKAKKIAQD